VGRQTRAVLVDGAVAVFVELAIIAGFGDAGIHAGRVLVFGVVEAVAALVDPLGFVFGRRTGLDQRARVSVPVAVAIFIPLLLQGGAVFVDVDLAVAVVVDAVAGFGAAGVHARPVVVAVVAAHELAVRQRVAAGAVDVVIVVFVGVGGTAQRVEIAVFVVSLGIADLGVAGITIRIVVVAVVAAASERRVPILVDVTLVAAHTVVGAFVAARRGARVFAAYAAVLVCSAGVGVAALFPVAEPAIVAILVELAGA